MTDWNTALSDHEAEQSGDIMDLLAGIARVGHERTMRQNGCPFAIRVWAAGDWFRRNHDSDEAWALRNSGPRDRD